jgi:hypothetical protein
MAKPSFIGSLMAGVTGSVKGAVALGVIGIAIAAPIGALLGAMGIGAATAGAGLALGTAIGVSMIGVGSSIGAIVGVVKSREAAAPSGEDIVNVAKISFAQGVAVGHDARVPEQSKQQVISEGRSFQERLMAERGAMGPKQV